MVFYFFNCVVPEILKIYLETTERKHLLNLLIFLKAAVTKEFPKQVVSRFLKAAGNLIKKLSKNCQPQGLSEIFNMGTSNFWRKNILRLH